MSLSASIVWEVRRDGSDSNGGGFKTGASGTDYSQQAAAQKSGSDLEIHASDATKVKPAAAGVAAADVGNLIQISAGTSFTIGFYEITAQDGTYWTLDRSAGNVGSTGGTYAMGGAIKSLGILGTVLILGHTVFVKYSATSYDISTVTYNVADGPISITGLPLFTAPSIIICGYDTNRVLGNLDANRPNLKVTIGTGPATGIIQGDYGQRIYVENIILEYNNPSAGHWNGFQSGTGMVCSRCEARGVTGGFAANACATACVARNCYDGFTSDATACFAKDCFISFNGNMVDGCVAVNGSYSGGGIVSCNSVRNSVIYGGYGFSPVPYRNPAVNCIAYGCATYGFLTPTGGDVRLINCAGGSNTSGNIATGNVATGFINLTQDPFVDAANENFALNDLPGGGALLKAAGFPGQFLGTLTNSYLDIGAVQHADPPPSGGGSIIGSSIVVPAVGVAA